MAEQKTHAERHKNDIAPQEKPTEEEVKQAQKRFLKVLNKIKK